MRTHRGTERRRAVPKRMSFWLVATLALCLASAAGAGTPINETRPAATDVRVDVDNLSGDITVVGWERAELEVTGTLGDNVEKLRIEGDAHEWSIKVERRKDVRIDSDDTELKLKVPRGASIELNAVSSNISVDNVEGRVESVTVSGDVTVHGAARALRVQTTSGDIELDGSCPDITAKNISGDVVLSGGSGLAVVETVSGDIDLDAGRFSRLEVTCVSGDIGFSGALLTDGSYAFTCHSGDITLKLPANSDATVKVSTFNGTIDNAFGRAAERTSQYAPGMRLDFEMGDGRANLRAETFSGDVRLLAR